VRLDEILRLFRPFAAIHFRRELFSLQGLFSALVSA
jgi:hypothetical protein